MFEATPNSQLENDEDPDLYDEESQDFFGGHEVKTKTTYTDVRLEAIQRQVKDLLFLAPLYLRASLILFLSLDSARTRRSSIQPRRD